MCAQDRRIFGPERVEIMEGWRKLRYEDCNNAYLLANVIRMTRPGRMRWVGHVVRMRKELQTMLWLEYLEEGNN
jgi:hypothetical protein